MRDKFLGGIIGFAVGDALGVPVEFTSRTERDRDPVKDMRSGGVHNQPIGTWSDDTSMTLCTMQSLRDCGVDYEDLMSRFSGWLIYSRNTPDGYVFDVGLATRDAICRSLSGIGRKALECGSKEENSCGNGSLMRMLPVALYLFGKGHKELTDESAKIIHNISRCTHAHPRCLMDCGIYCSVVFSILSGGNLNDCAKNGIIRAMEYYAGIREFNSVYDDFCGLLSIENLDSNKISGSGYVLNTLEAAIWCLMTTDNYSDCVLKAVNLGEDTDTTAAVAGSLAGAWYGVDGVPNKWVNKLARKEFLKNEAELFMSAVIK